MVAHCGNRQPTTPEKDPIESTKRQTARSDRLGVQFPPALQDLKDIKARAMEGEAEAQRLLALIYELGLSGEVDGSEAAEWYMRAALRGLVAAQFQLARLYVEGRGVPQDYVSGYVWMTLAGRAGHETARTLLPILAQWMSNQELAEANERVAALRKTESKG